MPCSTCCGFWNYKQNTITTHTENWFLAQLSASSKRQLNKEMLG